MSSTAAFVLVDGVRVVASDSLDLITPYVLREQLDWFEDEIKFLRRLLRPGQKVIDIGANCGVYTLTMANTVGPAGNVWAFEPATATAKLLADGITANGFAHVVLERSALSSRSGTAQLSLNQNSELNALVEGAPANAASETVLVSTLDACSERFRWQKIDFMKIDAEGEEAGILRGGERFFADFSPLVQYEVKAGADVHFELVRDFAARGYESYRLVPGLDLLVPFDAQSAPDPFLLNLFCCKPDCAERLSTEGFLLKSAAVAPAGNGLAGYDWRQTIAKMPYGSQLADPWEKTVAAGNSGKVAEGLALHSISRDASRSPGERFGALRASFGIFTELCRHSPPFLRQASLARIARDYGARSVAVNALHQLSSAILQRNSVDLNEPFLAPGARFDAIRPGGAISNWILAAVLEELERLCAFSSYFTGASAVQRLDMVRALGYGDAEMARRWQLVRERVGPASS